jgi:hypothetical protein
MRYFARALFAILVFSGAPILAYGQFQEPTAEELHMTSDPKAPGASAVYLYLEEKTDDAYHYHSYYARIKVLTEKGKELATVNIPYEHGDFKVAAIQGRTIHSDGSIVPLAAKPSDLMAYRGGGHQYNEMTFTLPSAEAGSILEYRLQLRYSDDSVSSPQWMIQQPYFVHKAHYSFNPVFNANRQVVDKHGQIADGLMYAIRLPPGARIMEDALHKYTLDVADIPPLPSGDWLPPLNAVRDSVIFYYTNANSGPEYWDREGKYWAKDAERFTAASGIIKKAAAELVAPGDNDESKARKIYAAVMKIDDRDFTRSTTESAKPRSNKDASGVWKQQSGSSDEIALLYVALARAAGLKAWPMQVVNRNRAEFEPTYLSTDQFDDYIAVVQIDGKEVYLDPGQRMCAFGVLHWKHELTKGFRLNDNGASIEDTPAGPPKAAGIQRTADVAIDDHGAASGKGRFVLSGQEALYWRQLALEEDAGTLAKDFTQYVGASLPDGLNADLEALDGLADYDGDLTGRIKLSGALGSSTGKRMIVPGFLFEARGKHPFTEEKSREVAVDLHYATMEEDEVTYHFPAGATLDDFPQDSDLDWKGRIGLSVRATPSEGALTMKRSLVRTSALLDASLYGNLRTMYMRISAVDQQQILLNRATNASVK